MKKLSGKKMCVLAFCCISLGGCNTARGAWQDLKGAYQGMRAEFDNTEAHGWQAGRLSGGSSEYGGSGSSSAEQRRKELGWYGPGILDHPSYGEPMHGRP